MQLSTLIQSVLDEFLNVTCLFPTELIDIIFISQIECGCRIYK